MDKISLPELKKTAVEIGWQSSFVEEVANLEWSIYSLRQEFLKNKADENERYAILEVLNAARSALTDRSG